MKDYMTAGANPQHYAEQAVLTILRRMIPGEVSNVAGLDHPALRDAGIVFETSRVHVGDLKVVDLFLVPTIPEKREPMASILRGDGWTLARDTRSGPGSSSLWLLRQLDYPGRMLEKLPPVGQCPGTIMLRPLRGGWLIGVRATLLKEIIRNGRGNYEL